jgi:hypothetical protein
VINGSGPGKNYKNGTILKERGMEAELANSRRGMIYHASKTWV